MLVANQAEVKPFNAGDWKIGIVVSQFNLDITDQLYGAALTRAAEYKIAADNIVTIRVAGAIEIPLALQSLAEQEGYRALLAIGCVIKGDTPHFDYVCKFVTEGILRVQLDNSIPIGFGVLTCLNEAQAKARAHLAGDHLDAALQLAQVLAV